MSQVAQYDKYNYDYTDYWNNREYEHAAEHKAIASLLRKESGKRFIDIGGSFGRNLPLYAHKYDEVIIMDYSLKTLLKYEKKILDAYPNAKLVAGNVYNFPFLDGSFDGALMVRVLHHINEPNKYFEGVADILTENGLLVQEFANKVHIKAVIKWVLKRQFENFDTTPYQQESHEGQGLEGSEEKSIFLNFHPKAIKEMMEGSSLHITHKTGCSFLRSPAIKRLLPVSAMLAGESILKSTLGWTNIPPSIIYKASKVTGKKRTANKLNKTFSEILACPDCRKPLEISHNNATCSQCNKTYEKHSTIWDLRT